MTDDLMQLRKWLLEAGVTHVAMEPTGVYWKPVFNLLEDHGMELLVVNARHVKAVPGRKTHVKDAEWLAQLFHDALLKATFIPDPPTPAQPHPLPSPPPPAPLPAPLTHPH